MSAPHTLPVIGPFLDHSEPWTEAAYLALGETKPRIELIDGGLQVSPAGDLAHQGISHNLVRLLHPRARAANLHIVSAVNVRLSPGRILIPDVTVGTMGRLGAVAEVAKVELVAEILSPSSALVDRVWKRELYAAAGIEWYLLVEPDMPDYESVTLRLLHRRDGCYEEAATAGPGETLRSDRPFPIELHTDALLDI
ncbi:Uma2 family endonuclease [Paractinoplanes atraurantiacus]|uniref:Putative restriction endonuclease n=1 Tax=Paractinoplanes atraurantiacus TaxID=1036182 RepID=A0A285I0I3_9ACTN|nr:Uma2 family endonuclease [Actinoplanes atraurantiacus]SNY41475.1 Putative restriction endonuclease [Actinoplanes atraurantiacus]